VNLGIAGRSALVCASSNGLGLACATALAAEGAAIVINGRSAESLDRAAASLRRRVPDAQVTSVQGDVTTAGGREAVLAACPAPDILVTNAGGPPVGDWRSFTEADWRRAVDGNMLSAILLIQSVMGAMMQKGFGRIVNITSAVVKMPHELLSLSTASRLGLTGFARSIAPGAIKHGITINNLLPEQFETDRLRSNLGALAKRNQTSLEEEVAKQIAANPAGRFGKPEEFGATCAFLCSAQAGYMTGQNILLDGGRFPGLF